MNRSCADNHQTCCERFMGKLATLPPWARTVFTFLCLFSSVSASQPVRVCEPIRSTMCKGLGYNVTGMPNLVDHSDQEDAILQLQTFTPLIQYNCSHRLKFFLCSVYLPMCTDKVLTPIGPCRPLCESVRDRCKPVLHEFGYPWPEVLNCSKFPTENNHQHMCMEGPDSEEDKQTLPPVTRRLNRPEQPSESSPVYPTRPGPTATLEPKFTDLPKQNYLPCKHLGFRNFMLYTYINRTDRCALLCDRNDAFSDENKSFSNVWMAVWASLCFVSTLFTILTFLINAQRFRYPERPIFVTAMCCNIYSIGYIVRLIAGRDDIACYTESQSGRSILIQEGLENTDCAIVFLLLYFFGAASFLWWVVLTFTWFLAAGRRWSQEAIQVYCSYYHLVAWTIPAIKTIVILVMRGVDADELSGVCYVGNQDTSTLMGFAIAPQALYLIVGTSFLVAGFVSIFKTSKKSTDTSCSPNPGDVRADKVEALMIRVGIFSVLYTVPAASLIGCLLYEYTSRESWYRGRSKSLPNVEIFMLKIFMSQVPGITSGMWVLSTRTLDSWKAQFKKVFGPRRHRKSIEYTVPVHHYHHVPAKPGFATTSRGFRSDKSKRGKLDSEIIV